MLAITITAPAPRKLARQPDDRDCAYCGARYVAFRTGLGGADKHASALIAAAGRHRATSDAGDGSHVTIASARRDLGKIKRSMFAESHGPGRCVADMYDDDQLARALDLDFSDGGDDAPF